MIQLHAQQRAHGSLSVLHDSPAAGPRMLQACSKALCDAGLVCMRGGTPSCGSDCSAAPFLAPLYIAVNLGFNVAVLNLLRNAGCARHAVLPVKVWKLRWHAGTCSSRRYLTLCILDVLAGWLAAPLLSCWVSSQAKSQALCLHLWICHCASPEVRHER